MRRFRKAGAEGETAFARQTCNGRGKGTRGEGVIRLSGGREETVGAGQRPGGKNPRRRLRLCECVCVCRRGKRETAAEGSWEAKADDDARSWSLRTRRLTRRGPSGASSSEVTEEDTCITTLRSEYYVCALWPAICLLNHGVRVTANAMSSTGTRNAPSERACARAP